MIRNIFALIAVCALATECSASINHRSRRNVDTCGVPKSPLGLIINGKDFPRGSFPWNVALMHTGFNPPKFFCGATLISRTFVISAAHCILEKHAKKELLPRNILALFGAHDLSDYFEAERIALSPKKIYIHDDWNHLTSSYDADVSLLEFWENKIHFGDYIQRICLWNSELEPTVTEGIVTGWGKSEKTTRDHANLPRLVKAVIQTNEECFLEEGKLLGLSSRRTFCAGLRNGSGVCAGDSGGGLFVKIDGVFHLKGIVSSSLIKDGGCDVSKSAIYTNLSRFKEWIKDITGLKVFCTFVMKFELSNCRVDQVIDSKDFVLASPTNTSIEKFDATANRRTKFLPRHVGKKLPNLKEFDARHCGLTILLEFYFKGMRSLENLNLRGNQITTIEPKTFDDLVGLRFLSLHDNRIETLDRKLFVKMVNLTNIYLTSNKIKFLSPSTFTIPGNEKLSMVSLSGNVCINGSYNGRSNLNQLETDLKVKCAQTYVSDFIPRCSQRRNGHKFENCEIVTPFPEKEMVDIY